MNSVAFSPHVFIATPCFGGVVTQTYMQSVIGCMASAQQHGIELTLSMIGNDALITRCRNTLLHQFMAQSTASHILFVDSDIGFEPDALSRIVAAGKDVVAGLYPLKDRYWDRLTDAQMRRGESPAMASLRYVGESESLHEAKATPGALVKAGYAGTGFMLISREAVSRMIRAYPETRYRRIDAPVGQHESEAAPESEAHALFDCLVDPETKTYLSEDFTFCHRWRAIGGEVWLDPSLVLTHTGPSTFSGDPSARVGILGPARKAI
ncbi:hypothetical protein [Acetobacter oeni]|uniref:Glycosyltransferase 2-like domain-containing protein n=1 Tax=Acetobacter oeni TaxID=304077 RepID=A0A511XN32_9PROT|nr:hypothetical protein [Acetobacter oeni]MBB3881606.1 hypothetical protein [Acetobacter oeni]NHO17580.1 hypothetical protein [Acetobacter oeni]GEN64346.1 hypothetical protein AOE01nite_25700 [Acetobacter oeni]